MSLVTTHNIEKLKETLDKILKDKVTYGFDFTARQITVEVERPETISGDVDVYDISSCRKDTDELLHILLGKGSQEDRKPFAISLRCNLIFRLECGFVFLILSIITRLPKQSFRRLALNTNPLLGLLNFKLCCVKFGL